MVRTYQRIQDKARNQYIEIPPSVIEANCVKDHKKLFKSLVIEEDSEFIQEPSDMDLINKKR